MIGKPPTYVGYFPISLPEVMYYLYLPVKMMGSSIKLPPNVELLRPLIERAQEDTKKTYNYVYLSARKGWATPDNPLNRPGWHCDGYGTQDLNYVWWVGPGTRFAVQKFEGISLDHNESLVQFEKQVRKEYVVEYAPRALYRIDPEVVHATPIIEPPGTMRQYVKVSFSNEQYNLENNSHNYLFDYAWKMHSREMTRNSPATSQQDYVK